jgi:hypothetical protein
MMVMIKIFLAVFFSVSLAQAAFIQDVNYNSESQTLLVAVNFTAGLKPHSFYLNWDACQIVDETQQIAARLIDTGWDDTGTENFSSVLSFDLSQLSCRPAMLTIRSGLHSHKSIWIQ